MILLLRRKRQLFEMARDRIINQHKGIPQIEQTMYDKRGVIVERNEFKDGVWIRTLLP